MTTTDVFIVGAGQAGVPLASRLAKAGKRVVLAERARPGGTCVNYGCTPTKTLIASARAAHVARTAGRLGVGVGPVTVDFAAVAARKDAIVRRWREGIDRRIADGGPRLRFVAGHARFVGDREIEVAGERYRADTIVINVGARAAAPAIPGLESVPWLDSSRALELRELPEHLLVVGGGNVGCELGQMYRRFGSEVTLVGGAPRLLEHEEPEASEALEAAFGAEGIAMHLGVGIAQVEKAADGPGVRLKLSNGTEVRGSHLLLAVGRVPNTQDLGCEQAGVKLDPKGYVVVDDGYATAAPGVYALGDATAQPQFTHTSWDDHRLLFDRLQGRPGPGRGSRIIPWTVFTDPQVAGVGLTESEAKARGLAYDAATMLFGSIARAIEVDETAGVMKILVDRKTEKILGATLVGAEAGELLHILVVLMKAGATVRAIVDAEFAHPTFAEGVQTLVMRLERYALR